MSQTAKHKCLVCGDPLHFGPCKKASTGISCHVTPKLRWAKRKIESSKHPGSIIGQMTVLQQQWQYSDGTVRWEDIPTEKEEES